MVSAHLTSPVILKHELPRLCRRSVAEVDAAEGLHAGVAPVRVGHVGERVHDAHGEGEGEAENPDENDHDLRAEFARFPPERVHDCAVSEKKLMGVSVLVSVCWTEKKRALCGQ